jgi:hypothetical protein
MNFFAIRGTMVVHRRHAGWFTCAALLALSLPPAKNGADPATSQSAAGQAAPVHLTAEQDHQRIMDLLHITSLRRGADGELRRLQSGFRHQAARSARSEKWQAGNDGADLVGPEAAGDRGRF